MLIRRVAIDIATGTHKVEEIEFTPPETTIEESETLDQEAKETKLITEKVQIAKAIIKAATLEDLKIALLKINGITLSGGKIYFRV